ncbi:MAG: thiamine phosphate synthase [Coriobacteriales bacterium]|jgi:thiamine-phosphate pyrophosphorylase|nr:thiamine phosphate synthase [Coriobacteriales bacterium]
MTDALRRKLLLYAVTDRSWLGERTLAEAVEQALAGGATLVQLREKQLAAADFEREARELKTICARYQVPLLINDDLELAARVAADGVHLGQDDPAPSLARARLGPAAIVGVSVRTVAEARAAVDQGADYLGVGAVFSTTTKTDAAQVSLAELAAICAAVDVPVVAIGGINAGNLGQLAGSGIAGVALVSALFAAEDITAATTQLRSALLRTLHPVAGVIFDMDGTLLDSMSVWETAGASFIRELGFVPEMQLSERFLKMSLEEASRYFIQRYGLEMTLAEVMAGVNQRIRDAYFYSIAVKGSARAVLEDLHQRGVAMCICTATDRFLVEAALQRLGLAHYFRGIVTIAESGHTKREPEIFEIARELLGTPREQTWVAEDALHALTTASAAGFPTVALYEQAFAGDQQELRAAADRYLENIGDWDWR